jgi:hypothetical protein
MPLRLSWGNCAVRLIGSWAKGNVPHRSLSKIVQPVLYVASPTNVVAILHLEGSPFMKNTRRKELFRAFLDFFVLFSGISTASNLARTQGRPLRTRGVFLFRSKRRPSSQLPNSPPTE